jgi:hypothetical protein
MAWGADGKPFEWSDVGRWGMGMLSPDDWKGRWIKSNLKLFDYQKELKKLPDHDVETENAMWARNKSVIRKMTAEVDEARRYGCVRNSRLRTTVRDGLLGVPQPGRWIFCLIDQDDIVAPWDLCNNLLHNCRLGVGLREGPHVLEIP